MPHLATCNFFSLINQQNELDIEIDPGMTLSPFPCRIGWDEIQSQDHKKPFLWKFFITKFYAFLNLSTLFSWAYFLNGLALKYQSFKLIFTVQKVLAPSLFLFISINCKAVVPNLVCAYPSRYLKSIKRYSKELKYVNKTYLQRLCRKCSKFLIFCLCGVRTKIGWETLIKLFVLLETMNMLARKKSPIQPRHIFYYHKMLWYLSSNHMKYQCVIALMRNLFLPHFC